MDLLDQIWQQHRALSALADRLHAKVTQLRRFVLALLCAGALTAMVSALTNQEQKTTSQVFAGASTLALALAAIFQARLGSLEGLGGWVKARRGSEALKAGVYQALALGKRGTPAAEADLNQLRASVDDETAGLDAQLSATAPDASGLPAVSDAASYREHRTQNQLTWHQTKCAGVITKSKQLRRAELAFTIAGAIISAIATATAKTWITPIVTALTTLAATTATHIASSKYEGIANGYAGTVSRLKRILAGFDAGGDHAGNAAWLVTETEKVLADQNAGWSKLLTTD